MMPVSQRIERQEYTTAPKPYGKHGHMIHAVVRYDDRHKNGHNTFSITASATNGDGGCMHEEVAKLYPQLAPLIKWHLTSADGPLHYIANTLYWLGYSPRYGEPGYYPASMKAARDAAVWPDMPESMLAPWCRARVVADHDDGDATPDAEVLRREHDAARVEATRILTERLPGLLAEFKAAVESLGFTY